MYSEKFKIEGFTTVIAEDGEKAINLILELNPSFILLDIMLPKFSGLDLLAQIKHNPTTTNIPVIALTNLAQKEEAQKALSLGAKEYLVKAMFTPEEVVDKVKQYLNQK
ncbi:hypothetical protein A2382_04870 [Candidatus Woesebacteria bacterium RIFOXYB1_FULL_38_16]|uniref:Response regulatory domain-containing protein n=1 Tax=Candidatus Woesebacteria bacterium RIFOXYB1_FULL_38_16 TaxID=1802538 RepID=A0A1F8CWI1_9BACT|nr:MAG: hypothetical protein A2191_00295 [Candidatus Woesebacteria bacterium RIFOXYA1_FULL_38_9]OGM80078.1 MAG: hypothetical protein A2382_04870 [Candidatus Woesebacteria bacterium RIFOXYB1_FULL_38_16]